MVPDPLNLLFLFDSFIYSTITFYYTTDFSKLVQDWEFRLQQPHSTNNDIPISDIKYVVNSSNYEDDLVLEKNLDVDTPNKKGYSVTWIGIDPVSQLQPYESYAATLESGALMVYDDKYKKTPNRKKTSKFKTKDSLNSSNIIYVAKGNANAGFLGNFNAGYDVNMNGADNICNTDSAKPYRWWGPSYKAMILSPSRYPCIESRADSRCITYNRSGTIESSSSEYYNDWVLKPRKKYYNIEGKLIGGTNKHVIFENYYLVDGNSANYAYKFLELIDPNPSGTGGPDIFTGSTPEWTVAGDFGTNSCGNWDEVSNNVYAMQGRSFRTQVSDVISNINDTLYPILSECTTPHFIYCAAQ